MTRFHEEVFQPRSVEELEEQMRRWDAGELDPHDLAILTWKANVFQVAVAQVRQLKADLQRRNREMLRAERSFELDIEL